jgi:hypothetical protein
MLQWLEEVAWGRGSWVLNLCTNVQLKSIIFLDITPCSPLKLNKSFGRTYHLHLQDRRLNRAKYQLFLLPAFTLVSCSAYSSTLKMELIFSSETSVDFQRTTRHYIPENNTLYNHCCEHLKSYTVQFHNIEKLFGDFDLKGASFILI